MPLKSSYEVRRKFKRAAAFLSEAKASRKMQNGLDYGALFSAFTSQKAKRNEIEVYVVPSSKGQKRKMISVSAQKKAPTAKIDKPANNKKYVPQRGLADLLNSDIATTRIGAKL